MTDAPKHIWCLPFSSWDGYLEGYHKPQSQDDPEERQYTLTDLAARGVADARKVDVAKLRAAINRESGGYWVPTDEMLRRILSALTDPMQEKS